MKSIEILNILRKIHNNINIKQRELARQLDYSLGKVNYIIKELQKKGLIKIYTFKKSKNKKKYIYILTANGIRQKTKLTINFMRKISNEYELLQSELKKKEEVLNYDSL
jgi:EPS-associated MarR family transcriptional regulator